MGRLVFVLRDNNGRSSDFGVNLRDDWEVSQVVSYANAIRGPLVNLSSAALVDARYELKLQFDDANPVEPGADVRKKLLVICRDADDAFSFVVPSPSELPFDTVGPLRAIRLGMAQFLVPPLSSFVQRLVSDTVTAWGSAIPSTDFVGGRLYSEDE